MVDEIILQYNCSYIYIYTYIYINSEKTDIFKFLHKLYIKNGVGFSLLFFGGSDRQMNPTCFWNFKQALPGMEFWMLLNSTTLGRWVRLEDVWTIFCWGEGWGKNPVNSPGWYDEYPIFLGGVWIHFRWCRISSIIMTSNDDSQKRSMMIMITTRKMMIVRITIIFIKLCHHSDLSSSSSSSSSSWNHQTTNVFLQVWRWIVRDTIDTTIDLTLVFQSYLHRFGLLGRFLLGSKYLQPHCAWKPRVMDSFRLLKQHSNSPRLQEIIIGIMTDQNIVPPLVLDFLWNLLIQLLPKQSVVWYNILQLVFENCGGFLRSTLIPTSKSSQMVYLWEI